MVHTMLSADGCSATTDLPYALNHTWTVCTVCNTVDSSLGAHNSLVFTDAHTIQSVRYNYMWFDMRGRIKVQSVQISMLLEYLSCQVLVIMICLLLNSLATHSSALITML